MVINLIILFSKNQDFVKKMKKFNVFILFGMVTLSFLFLSPSSAITVPVKDGGSSADTLLVGTTSFGYNLDPQNAWDSASFDIIHQVSEGLFAYDLGDPFLRIVPRLAADCGTWSEDHLEFTVTLRNKIAFHNGNPFDAAAVKASFDRLIHLIETGVLQTAELYEPLNEELVIRSVGIIDEFTIKFVLNYKFAPFVSLLCITSSMIIDASVMPDNDIISTNDTLIGTGPYKFMSKDGEKVKFEYYEDYYRGTPAVKKFYLIKFESSGAIETALLGGDIHMVPGNFYFNILSPWGNSDILTYEEPIVGSVITYIGMNNELINKTLRHAISLAIDYDYIINSIYRNLIVRMTSVIPPGITYHQPQNVSTHDVSKARQILIDAGLSKGLNENSVDSEWITIAESEDPIAHYNYTYNEGNWIREEIGIQAQYDLSLIGISVELTGVTWTEFLNKLFYYPYELNLYLIGWMPDYNDPSNYINPLFSITSMSNTAQVNDPWLQGKMMEGLNEFNETLRAHLYGDIQKYLAEDLMPWIFLGFDNGGTYHSSHVRDLQRNALGYFYVFPLTWYGENATWDDETYCNNGCMPIEDWPSEPIEKIPGYSILVMLSVATVNVVIIMRRRKKNDS